MGNIHWFNVDLRDHFKKRKKKKLNFVCCLSTRVSSGVLIGAPKTVLSPANIYELVQYNVTPR